MPPPLPKAPCSRSTVNIPGIVEGIGRDTAERVGIAEGMAGGMAEGSAGEPGGLDYIEAGHCSLDLSKYTQNEKELKHSH